MNCRHTASHALPGGGVRWLTLLVGLLWPVVAHALGEPAVINIGKTPADSLAVTAVDDAEGTGGGFWTVRNDFEVFLAPAVPRGEVRHDQKRLVIGLGLRAPVKIADIDAIRYRTRTGPTPAGVNVMLNLYTAPGSDPNIKSDDETWYQRRATSEPLYSRNYKTQFPPNRWNIFLTNDKFAPLTFYDLKHGPPGFAKTPTLDILQRAGYGQLWRDLAEEGGASSADTMAYGQMTLQYISLATYKPEGNWKDFSADLDYLRIDLKSGESVTADFTFVDGTTEAGKPAGQMAAAEAAEPVAEPEPAAQALAPAPTTKPASAPTQAPVIPIAPPKAKTKPATEAVEASTPDRKPLYIGLAVLGVAVVVVIIVVSERNRRRREKPTSAPRARKAEADPRKKNRADSRDEPARASRPDKSNKPAKPARSAKQEPREHDADEPQEAEPDEAESDNDSEQPGPELPLRPKTSRGDRSERIDRARPEPGSLRPKPPPPSSHDAKPDKPDKPDKRPPGKPKDRR